MKLTVFIREKVEPKFFTVLVPDDEDFPQAGKEHPEQRQTPVPTPVYPATFVKRWWYDRNMDYYGDSGDPHKRAELWEDTEGTATWEEIIAAFPNLTYYYQLAVRTYHTDLLNRIVTPYESLERESWPLQQSEAEAWHVDNTANVPLITNIAAARGITLSDLVGKILGNVDLFRQASGTILGKQQAMLDRISAANSLEDLEVIEAEIGRNVLGS